MKQLDCQEHHLNWDKLPGRKPPACKIQGNSVSFRGKRVLITGAAGCIGSALARAILAIQPEKLLLLDSSEQGIYEIDRDLQGPESSEVVQTVLGSVCDSVLIDELLKSHTPHIIFHAAAFKHVPLLESNPFAALTNNSLGTATVVQSAVAHGCEQLILVSTDKAASPISIMGVSKRVAEMVLLALHVSQTQMKAVRLGNVLNSPGSIVPLLTEQIESGKALTVTHPEVRRYFMTIEEVVGALLESSSPRIASGVLVPRMGEAIRVVELARYMISELRPKPAEEPNIVFTGLRPGDKLGEVLISKNESWEIDDVSQVNGQLLRHVISPSIPSADMKTAINELENAAQGRNLGDLLGIVRRLVPEYEPSPVVLGRDVRGAVEAGVSR